jgi:hypothetical protein
MVYVTNVFNLPFLIVIWLIELYLFMASARLVMARIPSARQSNLCQQLKLLTDFLPEMVGNKMVKWKEKPIPSWMCWFIVMVSGFILRQVLIVMVTT